MLPWKIVESGRLSGVTKPEEIKDPLISVIPILVLETDLNNGAAWAQQAAYVSAQTQDRTQLEQYCKGAVPMLGEKKVVSFIN